MVIQITFVNALSGTIWFNMALRDWSSLRIGQGATIFEARATGHREARTTVLQVSACSA
jgi:hypothetical protein